MASDETDLLIEDDFTNIPQEAPPRRATPREVMASTIKETKRKTLRVILEEVDEIPPIGLFVGVNGNGFLIKPGVEVDLPMEVIHVLNNAVQSTPIVDDDSKSVTGWRERMRYPYRVVSPTQAAA